MTALVPASHDNLTTGATNANPEAPATVRLLRWTDPAETFDARSSYAEQFWLPTLGPTALLVLRHAARRFQSEPNGFDLDIATTSAELGLGVRVGNASPLRKAFARLAQFQLAAFDGVSTLAVKDRVPPVADRHLRRLPITAQRRLALWKLKRSDERFQPVARAALRHALNDPTEGMVERALFDEGHHPALCFAAAEWACEVVSNIPTS